MEIERAIKELYIFASEPRVFELSELTGLVDPDIDPYILKNAIINKSNFITIHGNSINEEHFILDSSLFKWLIQLNLRLAKIRQFELTKYQLTSALNNLRIRGRWDNIPIEILQWAESLGLIHKAYVRDHFVFPLAKILSLMRKENITIVVRLFTIFCEGRIWNRSLNKLTKESLKKGFSKFDYRISYIVKRREGIQNKKIFKLQELGHYFNLTRERVRQLENKFWNFITLYDNYRESFLESFLFDFFSNKGSLILDINSRKTNLRRFLAKCVNVPQIELQKIGLVGIALVSKDFEFLSPSIQPFKNFIHGSLRNLLKTKIDLPLPRKDALKLIKRVTIYKLGKLNNAQRTYIALESIGKPAHYSEIAEKYNSIWPNKLSERNIHGILNRQEYGIVWTGIKGTYALKEWGYIKPSKTIFETLAEIVKRKYEETKMPVPVEVIKSEMAKYRKLINQKSINIAINSNPRIKRVFKDRFIPADFNEDDQKDIPLNDLDKKLKEFEESIKDK